MNLYSLLQASASDPISPNILLNVTLADLHQLVVDTIEATRERLLPALIEQENQNGLLKREEAMKLLGIRSTTLHNIVNQPQRQPQTKPKRYEPVVIPPLPDGFMGARIAAHDHDSYQKGEAICAYICKPNEIVGKHHWIWYDFKTCQPRCESTPPPADRYIPDTFKQNQSSGAAAVSQSNGVGITMSVPSFSGNPITDEGFAHGNGLPDDFKLWLSRHPGMTIDEALHRYRDEQKAKRRRQGPKLQ